MFPDFFEFIFEFKSFKNFLKNNNKGFSFCAGPTWMRRGTQGHVAEPRGPTRALGWHGCDTCAYLYLLVI